MPPAADDRVPLLDGYSPPEGIDVSLHAIEEEPLEENLIKKPTGENAPGSVRIPISEILPADDSLEFDDHDTATQMLPFKVYASLQDLMLAYVAISIISGAFLFFSYPLAGVSTVPAILACLVYFSGPWSKPKPSIPLDKFGARMVFAISFLALVVCLWDSIVGCYLPFQKSDAGGVHQDISKQAHHANFNEKRLLLVFCPAFVGAVYSFFVFVFSARISWKLTKIFHS